MEKKAVAFDESRYAGASVGCSMFVGLYKAFEQELGKEHALPVLKKFAESLGRYYGEQLKAKFDGRQPTPAELADYMGGEIAAFGSEVHVEPQADRVKVRIQKCPIAAAHAALGLDLDAGQEVCRTFGVHMDAVTLETVGWTFQLNEYRKD